MADPFIFTRRARRPSAFIMTGIALIFLCVLIFGVQAHPVVVAAFAALISPALWDVFRNTETRLELDETEIRWQSGRRKGTIPLGEIDRVKLRTTLDFSQRATVQTKSGRKLRLPPECLPPGRTLDSLFEARGIPASRSLFGG